MLGRALFVQAEELGEGESQPNILMIIVDDLNDWVGAFSTESQAVTPNIDRLAASGVSFLNAHAQAPLCGPSRASVFTGLYPSTTGIYVQVDDDEILQSNRAARQATFLTKYFAEQGYHTMGAGKILHQGAQTDLLDDYGGFRDYGPRPEKPFRYDQAKTSTDWGAFPGINQKMPDSRIADYAVHRLAEPGREPFFLVAGFIRPHVPWYVPEEWFDKFPTESLETPPYRADDLEDVPAFGRRLQEAPPTPSTDWLVERNYWLEVLQAYLACVSFVDFQIGRVLQALETGPYADNTIVVLWSDHGYHLGEKGIVAKMTLWERSTRVPLIFAGPGIEKGGRSLRPVGLIDIYPTLVDVAGLPEKKGIDGHSLVGLLQNTEAPRSSPALTFWGQGNTAVRSENFRYIRYRDGSEELYDHRTDPHEWHNLAGEPGAKPVVAELRGSIPEEQASMTPVNRFFWNDFWVEETEKARMRASGP